MTLTLQQFNALPVEEAHQQLLRCCGTNAWAAEMVRLRPFSSRNELCNLASEVWKQLSHDDWLEAFRHHPRIGDRNMEQARRTGSSSWAKHEQSGVATATDQTRLAMLEGNATYEERFGYVFLICATGKTADEMLGDLQRRLKNDPETEIRIAAEQQAMITRLRLERLLQP